MTALEASPNRRIITVDDNEEIHKDFRAVLMPAAQSNGLDELEAALFGDAEEKETPAQTVFEVDRALQGQEALEKVEQAIREGRPYALAFVDMRMPPGWDGVETVRRIWQVDPHVQIVICTAYSDHNLSELRTHFRRTDSFLILKKPFDAAEVEQLAHALTEKWALARQASMRMEEMHRLVEQRTAELTDSNRQLQDEILRRKSTEDELRQLTFVDGLTGVSNRRMMDEMLDFHWPRAAAMSLPLSVLMMDLDFFKQYNDCHGHPAGDSCLKRVAKALLDSPNRVGDLVVRYGGEEFLALLPETDSAGAMAIGERMRRAVEELGIPHGRSDVSSVVTISVGCATVIPEAGLEWQTLINRADHALYRAKKNGRNRLERDSDDSLLGQ